MTDVFGPWNAIHLLSDANALAICAVRFTQQSLPPPTPFESASILSLAIQLNWRSTVQWLLNVHRVCPNDASGVCPPLGAALISRRYEYVPMLVAAGADIHWRAHDGRTLFSWSHNQYGNKLLFYYGARPNCAFVSSSYWIALCRCLRAARIVWCCMKRRGYGRDLAHAVAHQIWADRMAWMGKIHHA